MPSLLHLDSSANRSSDSVSRQLTTLFAETWRARHGSAGYRYRDLAADPVPPLDTAYCTLGRRLEQNGLPSLADVGAWIRDPAEEREWALTRPLITELLAADTVLIGAPMYNYSVSALLKAWIDRVGFPGVFTDPVTGGNLLRDARVVVITTRGGAYGPGTPREAWDFQTAYLRTYFAEQGMPEENIRFVSAEMTMAGLVPHLAPYRPLAADSLAAARAAVTALATAAPADSDFPQHAPGQAVQEIPGPDQRR
ncbi:MULTISPECIES: NAD(P)H-dependent oxidoreductase [unclassified Streptomyces]|uniref:FMN-dependent NADH-azoreductase n=1 Tax=unclassified Streptomyces TaxID=2593676 RepID=UPI002E11260A|nr:NAD(P)H-dependent oxidoreductase [Streptomyces sp. NBC_01197]WSS50858.1 NAD(P)H-dependent oxidoreductase [Streptomyces sp. NBC_01180]